MFTFEPVITVPSKKYPGVSFRLLQFTEGKRLELRLALAKINTRLREIAVERVRAVGTPDQAVKNLVLNLEYGDIVEEHIDPAWFRTFLLGVDGFVVGGVSITGDSPLTLVPHQLYREVIGEIQKCAGLTDAERGESEPPITSQEPADGRTPNTSAPVAVQEADT